MRNFRVLFTFLAVLFMAATTSAQSQKLIDKAEAKTQEISDKIVSIDESLALSEEQFEAIHQLMIENMQKMNKLRKNAATKEEGKKAVKPVRKAMNKQIRKEILSKEQRKAWNAASKKK